LSTSLQSITLHDDSRFSSPPALAGLFDQLDRIHAEGFGQLADRCHVRLGSVLLYSVNGVLADAGEFGEVLLPQVRGAKLGRRDSANFGFTEFYEVRHALQCPSNTKYTTYRCCAEFCNHSYLFVVEQPMWRG
jgi:hypothetical protein